MYRTAAFKPPRFTRKVEADSDVSEPPKKTARNGLKTAPKAPKSTVIKQSQTQSQTDTQEDQEQVLKRRASLQKAAANKRVARPVLHRVSAPVETPVTSESSSKERYLVQWRKRSTKKNKTWEGDGKLTVTYSGTSCSCILKDSDGKQLSKKTFTNYKPGFLEELISLGQFELEVDCKDDTADFGPVTTSLEDGDKENLTPNPSFKKMVPTIAVPLKQAEPAKISPVPVDTTDDIILPSPKNTQSRPVIIDRQLSKKLRPHQVEGVRFLYECLLGFRDFEGNGCLLADEMGLGKTLMTISLIWTLYKQSPFLNQSKVINKILICCPVTLINNWKSEFKKWLGSNKIQILTLSGTSNSNSTISDKQNLISFGKLNVYQVLIINYEKVSAYHEELSAIDFDLLVCDEGHRLKNKSNKVLNHLTNLKIPKKILLTGTPIQNDLVEFYTIINFINPGVLGDFKSFQKDYVSPILKSRDVQCMDPLVKRNGERISNKLIGITKQFTLRRTQSILMNYLTSRTDVVLYVPPTALQTKLFHYIMRLKKFNQLLVENIPNQAFTLINLFKKICNSPSLLKEDSFFQSLVQDDKEFESNISSLSTLSTSSGKINILIPLLLEMTNMGEKVVLISNYTQTLDLLETILNKLNLSFLRLDGSTQKNVRSKLVSEFNKASAKAIPVFLLSSKSGGMGINLVGASRLILFDNDWNPSVDLQSMARIHRDGQSKSCYIYRIMTAGCIDEKIFQRQLMKNNLSSKFLDNDTDSKSDVFDSTDMKNLFEIDTNTKSNTHDLLECDCVGHGENEAFEKEGDTLQEDTDEEIEVSSSLRQSSWVSALELKNKVDETDKSLSIKHALHDYLHFDPSEEDNVARIMDPVLANIIGNSTFKDKSKLPISYIMLKVFAKNDAEAMEVN